MANNHHGLVPFKGIEHLCTLSPFRPGRFARLFADLPPLYVDPLVLHEVGKAGGKMEDKGAPSLTNKVPAGQIFFGQFIDHDITLDDSSSLTASNDPQSTENVRTPTLDLDCVYGDGPGAHPYLYDVDAGKLLTGTDYVDPPNPADLRNHDLPRSSMKGKFRAIIGDPRNDENRIISQMQLGFLRFHNTVVDTVAAKPNAPTGAQLFAEARRIVTWHYQWVVVNNFLRTLCGNWIVDDILANGRKVYRPECLGDNEPFIPIEFATAAYRFGHTMIPQKFSVKPGGPKHDVFGATLGEGFQPVTSLDEVVDWAALLDSGNGQFERAGALDTKLAKVLLDLPFMPPTVPAFERSLAVRNLLRAQSFLIPSGEQVAGAIMAAGATEITTAMIETVREEGDKLGFPKATPLWIYLLAEGKAIGRMDENAQGQKKFVKGEGLGPVGARLVGEVIIGLLELDSRSFLGANRNWSPADTNDKIGANGVTNLYQLLTA
jgi:hypothetical protein